MKFSLAIYNAKTGLFQCQGCGVTVKPPDMPCEMKAFARACNAFSHQHRYCVHPDALPAVALSLRQPWAWLMIRPDITDPAERAAALAAGLIKDIENRKKRWHFRGRCLVHASKGMTLREYFQVQRFAEGLGITIPKKPDLQFGGIIGEFTVIDRVTEHPSPWFFGPYGYVVKDAKPLPFQPCDGALGWFTPKLAVA
ncbi:hypothetical protein OKA05_09040 [Luteolibacter arcticus]|uniref:Uncharacterized protein n=1 Tax=Luteolibacter arcticus TaxID=1581411 RepID=A0ABT3GGE8_9BACT|nr:hypothetical protein [Luteolibacter arcticus]MCW1922697.1 hypothetical protein [Luteolibacter arcticus]